MKTHPLLPGAVYVPDHLHLQTDDAQHWAWCLHCERPYPRGWTILSVPDEDRDELLMCPYKGCDGDCVLDLWNWSSIREANPEYPETPQIGTTYALYPKKGAAA